MVRSRVLDLLDLALVCSDGLEHAAHAANEADLLLEDLHAVPLRISLLLFFVLSILLLLQNRLHVLSYFDALLRSKSAGATLLHQVLHHVSNLFHEEGYRPFEQVHSLGQVERVHYILVLFNVHFVVFDEDDGALVVIFAAVIWRTEQSDKLSALEEFVSILHYLMRSANEIDIVLLVELAHYIFAECEADASIVVSVGFNASLRIRP